MTIESQSTSREFIVFKVGEQEFCVDIMEVREIRGWTATTPIPHSPDYVIGVINLRGTVLPVLDLSARLGGNKVAPSQRHAIIVVQESNRMTGLLVEAVSDIISISSQLIHATPDVSSQVAKNFLTGIVTIEGRMISLLSLSAVLPERQLKVA